MSEGGPAPLQVLVGADIGGTSSKVAVGLAGGPVLSYATGPGGNIRSSPGSVRANLAQTLRAALADARVLEAGLGSAGSAGPIGVHEPGAGDGAAGAALGAAAGIEVSGLIGMAGAGTGAAPVPEALEAARGAWSDVGLPGEPRLRGDLAIAYAAAAQVPDGLLLLSGTGAVAARVRVPDARPGGDPWAGLEVTARCDGMGWILGDGGSAVWIGLAGLRAAAAHLDGRGPSTALTGAVLDWAGVADGVEARQGLIVAVHSMAASQYGGVAPLVANVAAAGDEVAGTIIEEAVAALVGTAQMVADPSPAEIVLAGSLLTTAGPVRDGVRAALATMFPAAPLRTAEVPVVGALRLAAAEAGWPVGGPADLAAGVRAVAQ
ncbi:BadF/BadG/BcrA/BcrD ATPase family protein [Occultella aeris]|uniref:BadF/BadG/BcrA/BcrD ATPase family protein n=1 Tax=Occultella aeris TaxID=2761496 RepID=A0A7M4DHS9_9MICO|nr:BadF/BadG/BcrA/BcrD ATPase family protein [Occultella aeris]VZO36472.1 BadF/BadG/BcrA/BcrD ATPase family protein [Occultella aeris]